MLHKIVEPDKTGDKYNVIFVIYVTKDSILFHPFHQTRHAFRY